MCIYYSLRRASTNRQIRSYVQPMEKASVFSSNDVMQVQSKLPRDVSSLEKEVGGR
jgi:hypothetical protein